MQSGHVDSRMIHARHVGMLLRLLLVRRENLLERLDFLHASPSGTNALGTGLLEVLQQLRW